MKENEIITPTKITEYGLEGREEMIIGRRLGKNIIDPYDTYKRIQQSKNEIINHILESKKDTIAIRHEGQENYNEWNGRHELESEIEGIEIHENGIVFTIKNTFASARPDFQYDRRFHVRLYIFDDGQIHYVFNELDEIECKQHYKIDPLINQDIIKKLDEKLGQKIKLAPASKEGLSLKEKIVHESYHYYKKEQEEIANNKKTSITKISKLLQPIDKDLGHTEKAVQSEPQKDIITNVRTATTPKKMYTTDPNSKGKRK